VVVITLGALAAVAVAWAVVSRQPRHAPPLVVEQWVSPRPDTTGKLVMLEFWATWCEPCKAAIPENNRLQERFRDDLVIIAISNESAEQVRTQVDPAIHYATAVDSEARMGRALGVEAIPATFIISPDGIIRWHGDPFLHHNHERNRELWDELITDLAAKYLDKPPRSRT